MMAREALYSLAEHFSAMNYVVDLPSDEDDDDELNDMHDDEHSGRRGRAANDVVVDSAHWRRPRCRNWPRAVSCHLPLQV